MDDGNTLLGHDELKKVVELRVNRKFMEYMRANHMVVIKASLTKDGQKIDGMKHGFNLAGVRDYVKAARKQGQAMTKEKGDASGSRPLKQSRISLTRSGTGSTRPAREAAAASAAPVPDDPSDRHGRLLNDRQLAAGVDASLEVR